jgi:hypothetical protein
MKTIFATAGAIAMLALTSAPAHAATPTQQATATARIYQPLSISHVEDLDFGVIVLNNTTFGGEVVTVSQAGAVTCGGGVNMTCSGTPSAAAYELVGTPGAVVSVSSPSFSLANGGNTLALTQLGPVGGTVTLDGDGITQFSIGGQITVAGATVEGVYSGTFAVTADYQ